MSDFQSQVDSALRGLKREMADIGGANSPELQSAGRVLAAAIRTELDVPGTKAFHSRPGQPPLRQRGTLEKSIGQQVFGGVLRVGSSDFVSRLQQFGVEASSTRARIGRYAALRARHAIKRNERRGLHIAPRPFMERAAELALPRMGDEFVLTLQHRGAIGS